MDRVRHITSIALLVAVAVACEDPARPVPDLGGQVLFVDSDPQGGAIILDSEETGQLTPALVEEVEDGARSIRVELDSAGFEYSGAALVVVAPELEPGVLLALTITCNNGLCLRDHARSHAPASARFAVNAAGPLFVYDGRDQGIVWPATTSNSYAAIGAATFAALASGDPVALSLRNAGSQPNYWAGRPAPIETDADPYRVTVPSWITPPTVTESTSMRGIEIVQSVLVRSARPDVIELEITWRNISADSVYRALDRGVPASGITFTDAWLGFILDADIGGIGETSDDLVSYSADRNLVFAYDGDFAAAGFSGGWNTRPALLGLMVIEGPGDGVRLNAWPESTDFVTGLNEDDGRLLVTASQSQPENHADGRIGFAPDTAVADYLISVATGPVTLAPGEAASARFAILLAAPAVATFTSGELLAAGDPLDANRPLAAVAAPLLELADTLLGDPVD